MLFEDYNQCPLLEDEESIWDYIPYCAMIYDELTAWTLTELCSKNYKDCPTYKKFLVESKK